MMNNSSLKLKMPLWFWIAAALGLAWNIFGVVQFTDTIGGSAGSMMAKGMTAQQAELYANLPLWMNVSFAVGVFGGVAGCVLLLLKRKPATPVFLISLIAYVILFIGDITQGVFAAFGFEQVVILTTVVLIAGALLWLSVHYQNKGCLR